MILFRLLCLPPSLWLIHAVIQICCLLLHIEWASKWKKSKETGHPNTWLFMLLWSLTRRIINRKCSVIVLKILPSDAHAGRLKAMFSCSFKHLYKVFIRSWKLGQRCSFSRRPQKTSPWSWHSLFFPFLWNLKSSGSSVRISRASQWSRNWPD